MSGTNAFSWYVLLSAGIGAEDISTAFDAFAALANSKMGASQKYDLCILAA